MSKICRTFALELSTIMKKRTYIQPKMETMVLPKEVLMGENMDLATSGSMGTVGGAPKRRSPVVLPSDTTSVF